MGKRRSRKKKRRARGERRQSGHTSGPEASGRDRESCSPAWNSLDEESLADYAENAVEGESGEEGEVAKLLSFLNFSVLPCSLEPYGWEPQGPATEEVDLLSELTSAGTHPEQEREGEGGREERERRRESRKRASRRRPNKRAKKLRSINSCVNAAAPPLPLCLCRLVGSRRGPDPARRAGEADQNPERLAAAASAGQTAGQMSSRTCERCCSWAAVGGAMEEVTGRGRRGKTRRRSRGERFDPLARLAAAGAIGRWYQPRGRADNRSESTTPVNLPSRAMAEQALVEMDCTTGVFLSTDTSATGEVEMGAEPEDSDHTPPADPSPGDSYDGERDEDEEEEEEEEDSDLSDSTTDSGCDGDDEESSVERIGTALPGWWEREPLFVSSNDDSDSDHDKLSPNLNRTYPPGPSCSRSPRSLRERLSMAEFKHPGKLGVRVGGKKKRCKPSQTDSSNLAPAEVNSKIAGFVQDPNQKELRFALVSRAYCRTISHLATAYRLHCEVEQAKRRLPVASPRLTKTPFTRLAGWAEVEPILRTHNSAVHILPFPGPRNSMMEVAPVVGGGVPVIDETNVGNRMLQGMGWRPGTGLGLNGTGIQEPIHAYIRPRRSGLGF